MIKAQLPADEQQRLQALVDYDVLDSEAEKVFDDLTELASEICETPISLISLIDPERQWFKSKTGLDVEETHRDLAFCAHAILEKELFEVPNALEDERFFDNPLVTDFPNIRFYAGTQLQTPSGYNIGTLCVISDQPKKLTPAQRKALDILGREVIAQLELRLKNKKLEVANKRKAEFLANVSHELRTPLNAIIGLSELSLSHVNADSMDREIYQYLQQINRSGTKLIGIINSVLELRKIEAGKMELHNRQCNFRELFENTVSVLNYLAEEKSLELKTEISSSLPAVGVIDQQKLSQILVNLITNAIKFTSAHKQVFIRAWHQDETLFIEIEDQGIGITERNLAQLFDRYVQVGKKKSGQEGTGLGLSITKEFIELMGGEITVTSAVNVGTSVNINLPFEAVSEALSEVTSKQKQTLQDSINVLIVEDNKVNQAVISAMMNKLELKFDIVDQGEQALPALQSKHYDLVLMDINLPGISGIEATKQIKQANIDTPVVALTADVFRTNKEKLLFDSFLTKPVQLAGLKQEIQAVLKVP